MLSGLASATTRYVAQSAGTFSGGTACNGQTAITPATFNALTPAPDDITWICGTLSFTSATTGISVNGSGTSGHPIVINFDTGGIIQAGNWGSGGAALRLDNQNWITVDGKGAGNAAAGTFTPVGIIQATLSGTTGGACIGGACTDDNGGTGISGQTTTNIVIKNLLIRDMYLRTSTSDYNSGTGKPDWASFFGIHASPSSNLTINNNYITETGQNLAPNGNSIIISNNYLDQSNHEVDMGAGTTSWSGLYIFNNHFSSMNHWDSSDPSLPYHHDGIHIQPGSPGFYSNVFIYNNTFDGDIGSVSVTGWIYAEQTCCTGGTIWVFNNTATATPGRSAPAIFGIYGASTENIANNTIFQAFYTGGGISLDAGLNSSVTINLHQNNILWGQSYDAKVQTGTIVNGPAALNFNTYVDGSANGNADNFTYPGNDTQSLTTWRSTALPGASTHDASSQLVAPSAIKLNTDGSLQSGSPAIGAGTNLFSTCNGQPNPGLGALCNDKNGNPRPSSGPWDPGPFNFSSAGGTVANPTCSPTAGTYTTTQTVSCSTTTPGAAQCYRLDGINPTSSPAGTCGAGSTTYSGPLSISANTTVLIIGTLSGDTDSSVVSLAYIIAPILATPTFSPNGGSFFLPQTETITCPAGSTGGYTTDGSTPLSNGSGTITHGTQYTVPFSVSTNLTLKAICTQSGHTDSAVGSAVFTFSSTPPSPAPLSIQMVKLQIDHPWSYQ